MKDTPQYQGFELGPIRPPSEAGSLLLRVTRNCPWNFCKFCTLYKGKKFSKRPVFHIKQDIDLLKKHINRIKSVPFSGDFRSINLMPIVESTPKEELPVFQAALHWYRGKMVSVFLQDANSLIIPPDDLVEILTYLREAFPDIQRITSYARSHTIARISDVDMARLSAAGLNRIHVGMESAADDVLKLVKKGVDKATHIKAGQKVKQAGIELSEYYMPGLGGAELSTSHAIESADALNQINPDFIRLRTLAVIDFSELAKDARAGIFTPVGDLEIARELLLFLEHLDGIQSAVKSDHILNLFQEVDGVLPDEKDKLIAPVKKFLSMDLETQMIFRVGRRAGIFSSLDDLKNFGLMAYAEEARDRYGITVDNIDHFTEELIKRYI
ncbi:Radical SAM domain protein [Desulfamplus magnetovallimortis]|uniref:Radical SAM domain protein n=1 Tax=Desulfamplus magnetovallimortis TaxID=1246637 RepID=A0A1W1HC50_9BACT|nr:radical SAM protein [Desulfamplus magnetovallimortis]SLM30029.1 Radical SAM domain protein [Desulfamplus magnetovallimortis]